MARTLVTLALFLALAAPANAAGRLVETGTSEVVAGPQWAGERLAWASVANYGLDLHVANADGSGSTTAFLRTASKPSRTTMTASSRYWSVHTSGQYCQGKLGCSAFNGIYLARLGDAPEYFAPKCRDYPGEAAVSENAVAYWCGPDTRVRDLSAPSQQESAPIPGHSLVVAGPYHASVEAGPVLTIRDWRSGEVVLRVPAATDPLLQADGKVVFRRESGGRQEVAWASPESPEPRVVADDAFPRGFAADRVLVGRGGGQQVRALDGSVLASTPHSAPSPVFNGTHIAWRSRRCALWAISVWDLSGEPPELPQGQCPLPGNRTKRLRADSRRFEYGGVTAILECPLEPRLGCSGMAELQAGSDEYGYARGSYALVPGERRPVGLSFRRKGVCKAGRALLRPAKLIIGDGLRSKRRWVRVSGLRDAVAECERGNSLALP